MPGRRGRWSSGPDLVDGGCCVEESLEVRGIDPGHIEVDPVPGAFGAQGLASSIGAAQVRTQSRHVHLHDLAGMTRRVVSPEDPAQLVHRHHGAGVDEAGGEHLPLRRSGHWQ